MLFNNKVEDHSFLVTLIILAPNGFMSFSKVRIPKETRDVTWQAYGVKAGEPGKLAHC